MKFLNATTIISGIMWLAVSFAITFTVLTTRVWTPLWFFTIPLFVQLLYISVWNSFLQKELKERKNDE